MKASFVKRKFQLWLYRVSHGGLLIRSPKDDTHSKNVDVVFTGVEYLDIPRFIPDLEIDEPEDEEVLRARERLGRPIDRRNVYVVKSRQRRFIVVGASINTIENDLEIFEDPFP